MKRTILYAYIALMVAVGLPFLANLGEQDAQESPGAVNPTPTAAVDEAPPSLLPLEADVPPSPVPEPDAPMPADVSVPETLRVLTADGSIREMDTQDYLTGVVSAEMPPGFHSEALKAQARGQDLCAVLRLVFQARRGAGVHRLSLLPGLAER